MNSLVEIAPLARETNALIDANREIVERSRTHVGNLAHAIKTPLSVIAQRSFRPWCRSVCGQGAGAGGRDARPGRASWRKRGSPRVTIIGTVTGGRARDRSAAADHGENPYRDRGITIEVKADPLAKFLRRAPGSRGNGRATSSTTPANGRLLHVFIEVLVDSPAGPGAGTQLRIMVDDDGRGLSAAERAQARGAASARRIQAGFRAGALDRGRSRRPLRRQPSLKDAPIGGLRAELVLPGV